VDEAVARAKKGRAELDATIQRMVQDTLKKTNLATRDDVAALTARLEKLAQALADKSG